MLFTANDSLEGVFQSLRHELHRGVLDQKHPFRFVSFGTINNLQPDIRYVVLRAIDEDLHFYFYTDYRSGKVADIKNNAGVSLLFYHPGKRVQVKVIGTATLYVGDERAAYFWTKVQGEAQRAYNTILPPGTPIAKPQVAYQWKEPMDAKGFCVIEVIPKTIEGLQLHGQSHIRVEASQEGGRWKLSWITP